MLHEIEPAVFDNNFRNINPEDNDICICFSYNNILTATAEKVIFPEYGEIKSVTDRIVYLFTIDKKKYFLAEITLDEIVGYEYIPITEFRKRKPKKEIFAGMTAYQLYMWYKDNRYCGRCGNRTFHDTDERMLKCNHCGNTVYPKIMPAVIVGVISGDRILVTRYKGRPYKGYALIAGFNEIGESAEETVKREVMEEAGLKVKNIRYFTSQPWGIAQDLLLGFFCDLDGNDSIKIDENELSWASWISRKDLDIIDEDVSLTNRMLWEFKNATLPEK